LPSKSFFKISEQQQLDSRRTGLNQYLKEIIARPDIFNSDAMKHFL
jgi:hypothetical protein